MYESWTYASPGSARSALAVVPHIMRLINPRSVVDVGCGGGAWLKAFSSGGVEKILGLDGDWVLPTDLVVPQEFFRAVDISAPFSVGGRFDLAICIEVAEHLPATSAAALVDSLVQAAPLVVLSAAIPNQGGVHHVNEQWPEYWARLFAAKGYRVADALRTLTWCDRNVEPCHAQNMLIYGTPEAIDSNPALKTSAELTNADCLARVHPRIYEGVVGDYIGSTRPGTLAIGAYLRAAPRVVLAGVPRTLRRWLGRRHH